MTTSRTTFAFAAVLIAAGVLAGCRAEEQGRPLVIKGTYRGEADTSLSKADLRVLKDRVSLQSGSAGQAGGIGIGERPSVERSAPSSKSLNERLRIQDAPPNIPSKASSVRRPHEPLADTAKAAPSDKALDKALNERLRMQGGPTAAPTNSNVSKPQAPQADTAKAAPNDKILNERLKLQEGPPNAPKSSNVSTPQKPATGTATAAPAAPTAAPSAPAATAPNNQPHN